MSSLEITPRKAARPRAPRLPVGFGLAIGAAVSLGMWFGLARLVLAMLGH